MSAKMTTTGVQRTDGGKPAGMQANDLKMQQLASMLKSELMANGELQKIRAQLCSAAFKLVQGKAVLGERASTYAGAIEPVVLSIVAEFLSFYDLRFTLETLCLELGKGPNDLLKRPEIIDNLNLKDGSSTAYGRPVVSHLAELASQSSRQVPSMHRQPLGESIRPSVSTAERQGLLRAKAVSVEELDNGSRKAFDSLPQVPDSTALRIVPEPQNNILRPGGAGNSEQSSSQVSDARPLDLQASSALRTAANGPAPTTTLVEPFLKVATAPATANVPGGSQLNTPLPGEALERPALSLSKTSSSLVPAGSGSAVKVEEPRALPNIQSVSPTELRPESPTQSQALASPSQDRFVPSMDEDTSDYSLSSVSSIVLCRSAGSRFGPNGKPVSSSHGFHGLDLPKMEQFLEIRDLSMEV